MHSITATIPTASKFIAHDSEHTLNCPVSWAGAGNNRLGPFAAGAAFADSNPQYFHQKLYQNAEYRLRFADRGA